MLFIKDIAVSLKDIRSIHYCKYDEKTTSDMKIVYIDGGKIYIKVESLDEYRDLVNLLTKTINTIDGQTSILKHRLEVANEYIETRKDNMLPEHYDDLKYIINECDLNSTW